MADFRSLPFRPTCSPLPDLRIVMLRGFENRADVGKIDSYHFDGLIIYPFSGKKDLLAPRNGHIAEIRDALCLVWRSLAGEPRAAIDEPRVAVEPYVAGKPHVAVCHA
jgi:hypothetical protein